MTLCYAGKIDAGYGLDWLADLAEAIAADPGLGLRVIAGKEAWRARHPAFFARMDALRKAATAGRLPGVSVVSNLPPSRAMRQMAEADFGYCLRGPAYDDVLEVSTKAMEFCALGVPPILNDTALNRDMFGADYPYLIDPRRRGRSGAVAGDPAGRAQGGPTMPPPEPAPPRRQRRPRPRFWPRGWGGRCWAATRRRRRWSPRRAGSWWPPISPSSWTGWPRGCGARKSCGLTGRSGPAWTAPAMRCAPRCPRAWTPCSANGAVKTPSGIPATSAPARS
ncbi:hypothetical protein ACFOHS_23075 [Jhaorihella thermophila]